MGTLLLEIPQEVTDALRLPAAEHDRELRTELAIALYRRAVLSAGKARKLAGMTRWDFDRLLGQRQIVRHYQKDELEQDLEYAQGG